MKPAPLEYVRPASVGEAVALLAAGDWGARALAGGQSLVPMLNLRLAPVTQIVDIARLPELRGVRETADAIAFGACVRHAEFEDGAVPDPANGMMQYVAHRLAYRAVRNRGTIGGSICLADPSADWLTVVIALGATLRIAGSEGTREIAAGDSISGAYYSGVEAGELLTEIVIPRLSPQGRWGFSKVIRKAGEYPVATASVVIDQARNRVEAVSGGIDRAPLRLGRTASELQALSPWDDVRQTRVREAFRADLADADRGETAYQATVAETAVVRAAAMALGA